MGFNRVFPSSSSATGSAKSSVLGQILPPDPKAPERPTAPGPTCGTLPPGNSLVDVLGKIGKLVK